VTRSERKKPAERFAEFISSISAAGSTVRLVHVWVDATKNEHGFWSVGVPQAAPVAYTVFNRVEVFKRPLGPDEDPDEDGDDPAYGTLPTHAAWLAEGWEYCHTFTRPEHFVALDYGVVSEEMIDHVTDKTVPLLCPEHADEAVQNAMDEVEADATRIVGKWNDMLANSN
jgi:hypothetical protein